MSLLTSSSASSSLFCAVCSFPKFRCNCEFWSCRRPSNTLWAYSYVLQPSVVKTALLDPRHTTPTTGHHENDMSRQNSVIGSNSTTQKYRSACRNIAQRASYHLSSERWVSVSQLRTVLRNDAPVIRSWFVLIFSSPLSLYLTSDGVATSRCFQDGPICQ